MKFSQFLKETVIKHPAASYVNRMGRKSVYAASSNPDLKKLIALLVQYGFTFGGAAPLGNESWEHKPSNLEVGFFVDGSQISSFNIKPNGYKPFDADLNTKYRKKLSGWEHISKAYAIIEEFCKELADKYPDGEASKDTSK